MILKYYHILLQPISFASKQHFMRWKKLVSSSSYNWINSSNCKPQSSPFSTWTRIKISLHSILRIIRSINETSRFTIVPSTQTRYIHMGRLQAESYSNLLYIMTLAIKNSIFNPKYPLFLLTDTSAVESSVFICNWHPDTLQLNIVSTKSSLLTTAMRR